MHSYSQLTTPWSLHFDRDGNGADLLTSRTFWLPEKDDPVPPTLAFVHLAAAAPKLLAALEAVLPYAENEARSLAECCKRDGEAAAATEAAACERAVAAARTAIAEATAVGTPLPVPAAPPARFEIEHAPQENPDRAYVLVDGLYDVAIVRTAEGLVIDVYPKDWVDPIDTMTVWDEQVKELEPAAAEGE